MQLYRSFILLSILGMVSCMSQEQLDHPIVLQENFQNKGHRLIYEVVDRIGNLDVLRYEKKDMIATYRLDKPEGKSDISMEKYIFEGERSYGKYYRHDYNLAELTGEIEEGFDGQESWITHNLVPLESTAYINRAAANRSNNYYWFLVLHKLLDPDLFYEYVGTKVNGGNTYDVVMVTLDPEGIKSSNQYNVYINQMTGLVDQIIYDSDALAEEYGPRLIQLEYEAIDGVLLPTKRRYKKSNWNGDLDDAPWTIETWSDVSFENDLTTEDFSNPG